MHGRIPSIILASALLLAAVTVPVAAQDAPEIISTLSVSGKRGAAIPYTIEATGDPVEFEATTDGTSLSLDNFDPTTGAFTIRILPEAPEDSAVIFIAATNEAAESASAEITVTILPDDTTVTGTARAMEAEIAIRRPRVRAADYELESPFQLKAKVYTPQPEAETKPGTVVAALRTERIANKDILEQMVGNGIIEEIKDFSLVMIGAFDSDPELFAVNRKLGIVEPVPAEILGLVRGEKIGGYRITENGDADIVSSRASGYQPLTLTWTKAGETMTLTGLGKYTSVLKFVPIDGIREPYTEETLTGKLSGSTGGGPE
jgi:hypothetical protein